MLVATLCDLEAFDSESPFPSDSWKSADFLELTTRIESCVARFRRQFRVTLEIEDPALNQDGSLYCSAIEYLAERDEPQFKMAALGGFHFSRYGNLVAGGKFDDRSRIPDETWESMKDLIGRDYQFHFVPDSLLQQRYSGNFAKFARMTWAERFFAPWYVHLSVRDL